ncbi:hypothetical protein T439DRAFT_359919 [Meredithblackwellia eburnea MCA 4105]
MSKTGHARPTRSSSLSASHPQHNLNHPADTANEPMSTSYNFQHHSNHTESDPLNTGRSPEIGSIVSPQRPSQLQGIRRIGSAYDVNNSAPGLQSSSPENHTPTTTSYHNHDQPYWSETDPASGGGAYAGVELPSTSPSHAHAQALHQGLERVRTDDTSHSRVPLYTPPVVSTPLHPGASIQMNPVLGQGHERGRSGSPAGGGGGGGAGGRTPEERYPPLRTEKGYRSPRAHSREGSRDRLGNWSGPQGLGNSPYGQLGQGRSGASSAISSNSNLQFAEGDFVSPPSNAFSRFIFAIFDSSFVVRWIIYIIPFLAILWIPGILGLTGYPEATVWGVKLVFWSGWLTVAWVGWWASALVARMGPTILRNTVGVVAPELRHYILYVKAIRFYVGATGWALANWASFAPLVSNRQVENNGSAHTLTLFIRGLFGILIICAILLVEKLLIQVIAHNFHKKSYEDRIEGQQFSIKTLTALYLNSRDTGHRETLEGATRRLNKRQTSDPSLLVKKALHATKKVAQTATTVIGTVASEIAGERVLQPNSPQSMVVNAISSANKTKQLARRIYYSYVPSYRDSLLLEDISRCFVNREQAEKAFQIFDKDDNGDITLEEIELACLEIHRERLALSNSMRDIDSAVGRLDSILMSVWYLVAIIIEIGLLDASFQTMIAGAGTVILGLSWLIGTTAQEILASIIFLFVKHAYDCGDRVDIDGQAFVVKEMHLLSTIFRRVDGVIVQAPHSVLNTKFINNIRRSGAIMEKFTWDVDFSTPFEKIEALRDRMLQFLEIEKRDFIPTINIAVSDFEGQGKMTLECMIQYKSNWQNGALKAQRRNKWCCALKLAMAQLGIYGPADAGNPSPVAAPPTEYTLVPYEEVERQKKAEAVAKAQKEAAEAAKADTTKLSDPKAPIDDLEEDVYDEKRL